MIHPHGGIRPVMSRMMEKIIMGLFGVVTFLATGLGVCIYLSQGMSCGVSRDLWVDVDLKSLDNALAMYRLTAGFYPSTEQGLGALVSHPAGDPAPKRWVQVMSRLPVDPFGQPYFYRSSRREEVERFQIFSMGPDGLPFTKDDIGVKGQ